MTLLTSGNHGTEAFRYDQRERHVNNEKPDNRAHLESKLRVLTSRNVLARVIDRLDLTNDPEFVQRPCLGAQEPDLVQGCQSGQSPCRDACVGRTGRGAARGALLRRGHEALGGRPEKAVAISNAIVEAFEAELFQSAAESAGRVVKNLNNRLDELRAT